MKRILNNIGWAILEIMLFTIVFCIVLGAQFLILQFFKQDPIAYMTLGQFSEQTNPYPLLLLNYVPLLISFTGASIVVHHFIFNRRLLDLGYDLDQAVTYFGRGWGCSAMMVVPGFLILFIFHQVSLLPSSYNWLYFVGFLLFFIVQSTGEEVLTRAFLIPMLEYRLGTIVAVICSASFFALMHIGNTNFTWLGFANILLGGAIMAVFFILYRNIWICAGFHAGWNFIQAGFFDFNVSGVDVYSLIQFQDTGYPRITGAAFGYEGSLVAMLFQGMLLAYLLKYKKPVWNKASWKKSLDGLEEISIANQL